jgi:ribosomal 50S subunit-recycling heat shock protein
MRIDKYLKNSRLIKRRTLAKEACEAGNVLVNGKSVKPGYEVQIGDKIALNMGTRGIEIEVLSLEEHVTKETSKEMYKVL